jgi:hypothetical protein
MEENRWRRRLVPGLLALGAFGLAAAGSVGADDGRWVPASCPAHDTTASAIARTNALPIGDDEAWYRLDPAIDASGRLHGQHLAIAGAGTRAARTMALPPEAFAAGPFGSIVIVGTDDGRRSSLQAIDVRAGCSFDLGRETSVIRRATVDRDGRWLYEFRVARHSRADLGVWRRPLDGSAPPERVLEPLLADDRFGRTFSTELGWSLEGTDLVVQSCGQSSCRTRVHEPATGAVTLLADPAQGVAIGLAGDRLVAYASCRGLPCPIVATDVATGRRTTLTATAGLAVLVASSNGPRLVHELGAEAGASLRVVALDGRERAVVAPLPDGVRLVPFAGRAQSATRLPAGTIAAGPRGRLPAGPPSSSLRRDLPDGITVRIEEASR